MNIKQIDNQIDLLNKNLIHFNSLTKDELKAIFKRSHDVTIQIENFDRDQEEYPICCYYCENPVDYYYKTCDICDETYCSKCSQELNNECTNDHGDEETDEYDSRSYLLQRVN